MISRVNYLLDSIEWNSSLQQLIKMNTEAVLPNVQGHALLLTSLGNLSSWVQIFQLLQQTEIDYTPWTVRLPTAGKKFLVKRPITIAIHHRTSLIPWHQSIASDPRCLTSWAQLSPTETLLFFWQWKYKEWFTPGTTTGKEKTWVYLL